LELANFAAPKGFALGALGLEASLGEDRGDGLVELVEERGSSSSFLRLIWGVGGVELVAVDKLIQPSEIREDIGTHVKYRPGLSAHASRLHQARPVLEWTRVYL
jgi:hypothetical protein